MSDEEPSAVERFSSRVRQIMGVLGFIVLLVVVGGVAVAHFVDPLAGVAYVVVVSVLAGMIFPRLT